MNQESAPELNPLTRWQIGGAAGGGVDADVPAAPVFGLNLAGQGIDRPGGDFVHRPYEYAHDFGGHAGTVLLERAEQPFDICAGERDFVDSDDDYVERGGACGC